MPKVSVIVPNYNHGRFLQQRLESIRSQTFTDYELIILDDCSTDNSIDIIDDFVRIFPARLITSKINSGIPFIQWNRGVQTAVGDYVWIAESDDIAEPELLAALCKLLDRHQNVGLAYCRSTEIDGQGNSINVAIPEGSDLGTTRWDFDFLNSGLDECRRYLAIRCTIPNASAVLFRRSVFLQAGGAEESLRMCGDWITWAKMLLISDVAYMAKPLNRFRYHSGSVRYSYEIRMRVEEEYVARQFIFKNSHPATNVRIHSSNNAFSTFRTALWETPGVDFAWTWKIFCYAFQLEGFRAARHLTFALRCWSRKSLFMAPFRFITRPLRKYFFKDFFGQ